MLGEAHPLLPNGVLWQEGLRGQLGFLPAHGQHTGQGRAGQGRPSDKDLYPQAACEA